jgi:hypothetical protein
MGEPIDITWLQQRIEFLEKAIQELNPGFAFPSKPKPSPTIPLNIRQEHPNLVLKKIEKDGSVTFDTKRKVKYLVFCEKVSQAYEWATEKEVSSLDWIQIKGEPTEREYIGNLWRKRAHYLVAVVLGNPENWNPLVASFFQVLTKDNMLYDTVTP